MYLRLQSEEPQNSSTFTYTNKNKYTNKNTYLNTHTHIHTHTHVYIQAAAARAEVGLLPSATDAELAQAKVLL